MTDSDALKHAGVLRFSDGKLLPWDHWGLFHIRLRLLSHNYRTDRDPDFDYQYRAIPVISEEWSDGDPVPAWMALLTISNRDISDGDIEEAIERWNENKTGYRLG